MWDEIVPISNAHNVQLFHSDCEDASKAPSSVEFWKQWIHICSIRLILVLASWCVTSVSYTLQDNKLNREAHEGFKNYEKWWNIMRQKLLYISVFICQKVNIVEYKFNAIIWKKNIFFFTGVFLAASLSFCRRLQCKVKQICCWESKFCVK